MDGTGLWIWPFHQPQEKIEIELLVLGYKSIGISWPCQLIIRRTVSIRILPLSLGLNVREIAKFCNLQRLPGKLISVTVNEKFMSFFQGSPYPAFFTEGSGNFGGNSNAPDLGLKNSWYTLKAISFGPRNTAGTQELARQKIRCFTTKK